LLALAWRLCQFGNRLPWAAPSDGAPALMSIRERVLMPKITYVDHDGTQRVVEAKVGSTVMETAIEHGVPGIVAECGGACACATCHVHVAAEWQEKVGAPESMEEDMLDFAFDVRPTSRLSCQIRVTEALDGLVVHTPERQG
jgi:ferredoxin, 2Fe-2S